MLEIENKFLVSKIPNLSDYIISLMRLNKDILVLFLKLEEREKNTIL